MFLHFLKTNARIVLASASRHTASVCTCVCEGGRETKGTAAKKQPKNIKVYGYICWFNVTFIIRSQRDALSDGSGRTKIGFCLHWHAIPKTWYGSGKAHIVIGSQWSARDTQSQWQHKQGEGIKRRAGGSNAAADLNESGHRRRVMAAGASEAQFNFPRNFSQFASLSRAAS